VSASTHGMDIQYAQVALGALGGALLAGVGAGAVVATTRGRRAAAHA
jgi:outer membrane lipoprotein SlyB